MIFTALDTVAYRVHDPKWAYAPTSGAGAGSHGGRANRPGISALYLSLVNDALTVSDSIVVHDPNHALPKNQDSWT